jgi:hypothetical protein
MNASIALPVGFCKTVACVAPALLQRSNRHRRFERNEIYR